MKKVSFLASALARRRGSHCSYRTGRIVRTGPGRVTVDTRLKQVRKNVRYARKMKRETLSW